MPKDERVELPVLTSEVAFKGKIWDIKRESFEYNGGTLVREFVAHPGAVAILAVDDEQRVLLIRQYRHPVRSYLWEIPAGLTDVPGEPRIDAAKRELMEETGYVAGKWTKLTDFMTTPGGNDEVITIFLAEELEHVGHDLELEGEEVDMIKQWFPLSEALASVLASEIQSPSAVVGIMAAALRYGLTADGNAGHARG
jgi:ADP-ribose pyrophosphatase